MPLIGNPTIVMAAANALVAGKPVKSTYEIIDATRVTAEKIKLITVWQADQQNESLKQNPAPAWMPWPGETWEKVIEKVDDKYRIVSSIRTGGKKIAIKVGYIYSPGDYAIPLDLDKISWRNTGTRTPLFERCLN
jgi:hypothetical protein